MAWEQRGTSPVAASSFSLACGDDTLFRLLPLRRIITCRCHSSRIASVRHVVASLGGFVHDDPMQGREPGTRRCIAGRHHVCWSVHSDVERRWGAGSLSANAHDGEKGWESTCGPRSSILGLHVDSSHVSKPTDRGILSIKNARNKDGY